MNKKDKGTLKFKRNKNGTIDAVLTYIDKSKTIFKNCVISKTPTLENTGPEEQTFTASLIYDERIDKN